MNCPFLIGTILFVWQWFIYLKYIVFEIFRIVRSPLRIFCLFVDLCTDLKSPTKGDFFFYEFKHAGQPLKMFLSVSICQHLELAKRKHKK